MNKILISAFLISAISLTTVFASNDNSNDKKDHDDDYNNARELVITGNIMPLEQILETVYKTHQGKILEVELEQEKNTYVYEIELLDQNNKVWEMEVNAMTGELMKVEEED